MSKRHEITIADTSYSFEIMPMKSSVDVLCDLTEMFGETAIRAVVDNELILNAVLLKFFENASDEVQETSSDDADLGRIDIAKIVAKFVADNITLAAQAISGDRLFKAFAAMLPGLMINGQVISKDNLDNFLSVHFAGKFGAFRKLLVFALVRNYRNFFEEGSFL